jgi:hypothetical protein
MQLTPDFPDLVIAIQQKQRLACVYHHKARVIEPQCYGIGSKGHELLRVHQISGGSQPEPLFKTGDIADIRVVGTFTQPGPNYTKNDSAMVRIFAQL